jgi:parvulin-like peptidyl-prolyl isomerase
MSGLWREPLLHFLLIGAALFGLYAWLPSGSAATPASKEIRLSLDELNQLVLLFRSQWKRPPTPQELQQLVENKVQQEVLYREALALGLDKDDEIVKRRMAQKMQFLAEDVAAAREPSSDELRRWFDTRQALFAQPSRFGFRHLYFSPDRRGARARDDALAALTKLAGQPVNTAQAVALADPFMFQDHYRDRTPEFLAKEFGPGFAKAVATLVPGSWQGPVESGFGLHLVYVDTVITGRVPAFEEIEAEVKQAWLAEQKAQASQKAYQEMRARYTVLLPVPKDEAAPAASASAAR